MTTVERAQTLLTDEMLARFDERAPVYDRENRFFHEDFDELRATGYLQAAVPRELGGLGMSLLEVAKEQRRLAYRAPATALAVNMHLYWTGVAADLRRMGDASLEWLLRESAAGEVFAAGHGHLDPVHHDAQRAEDVDPHGALIVGCHRRAASVQLPLVRMVAC